MTARDLAGLGAILDGIPARVALLDRARRHRYANQDYARFAGCSVAALLGRSVAEMIGATAFARLEALGRRALAGETLRWEGWLDYAGPGALAGPRYVQRVYTPWRGPGGGIDGYLVFVRDLTELKQSEAQLNAQLADLRMSQALNAAIIASALDCIVVIDEAGRVVEFNPAAERVFGHARAAVIGRPMVEIIVPPHLRERHARGFARYMASGQAQLLGRRIEIEGLRADGTIFPVELAITEVRLPERRLFTAYLRDLTGSQAAAAELQRSRDALHRSETMAAFGSLLAGVAHELNNPLSIVAGHAMLLQEDTAAAEPALARRAGKIHQAAERCARVVRSFLAMARQRPVAPRAFPLAPLLAEAVELLAYGLRSAGIAVTLDLPPELPPAFGDPDQLGQVVVNLLVNAQQALAGQTGPRRISASAGLAGDRLWLAVADNGPGVPAAIRDRIFDPFFTTKPVGQGTGIGLAVSRGIVEAHGGTLLLESPAGGGARFVLQLRQAATAPLVPAPPPGLPAVLPGQPRPTALVVDDEPELAAMLAEMLQGLGFRCDIATGGAAGRRRLRQADYDVILCDLQMPGTDGAALFAWLGRRKPHLRDRVAFVTADTLGVAATGFLQAAGRPVLDKPFRAEELRQLVQALGAVRQPA